MSDIIKEGVRILRPAEANQMISDIPHYSNQVKFKALLYSGMRYAELKRLYDRPEWFDGQFIHIPSLKKKARQKERWIRLNGTGKEVINSYLNQESGLPHRVTWFDNLKRWAETVGDGGMSLKTTRKTWESWLMFTYPQHKLDIILSQGHTLRISFDHYMNLPFTDEDKVLMDSFVGGWI